LGAFRSRYSLGSALCLITHQPSGTVAQIPLSEIKTDTPKTEENHHATPSQPVGPVVENADRFDGTLEDIFELQDQVMPSSSSYSPVAVWEGEFLLERALLPCTFHRLSGECGIEGVPRLIDRSLLGALGSCAGRSAWAQI
jgi:hypothetical protein